MRYNKRRKKRLCLKMEKGDRVVVEYKRKFFKTKDPARLRNF